MERKLSPREELVDVTSRNVDDPSNLGFTNISETKERLEMTDLRNELSFSSSSSTEFRSVLPHEPLPNDDAYGYVHLQGAFLPRRTDIGSSSPMKPSVCEGNKKTRKEEEEDGCSSCRATRESLGDGDVHGEENGDKVRQEEISITATMIESALLHSLTVRPPSNTDTEKEMVTAAAAVLSGLPHCVLAVHVDPTPPYTKARLAYANSRHARNVVSFLKCNKITPSDLLRDSFPTQHTKEVLDNENQQQQRQLSYQFSTRPIQATQITTRPLPSSLSPSSSSSSSLSKSSAANDISWARASPPKFRRLLPRTGVMGTELEIERVDVLERQRRRTRFVFMTGIVDDDDDDDDFKDVIEDGILPNNTMSGDNNGQANNENKAVEDTTLHEQRRRRRRRRRKQLAFELMNDNNIFLDALREVLNPYDTSGLGVEIFLPNKKNKSARKYCHVGMRSHADAERLVIGLQGRHIDLTLRGDDGEEVTITSGKLFLDYADITYRSYKKSTRGVARKDDDITANETERGEPSKSECTSTTDSVIVPGLVILPDFVSTEEEEVLMAALTGPDAPWAPSQTTPSKSGTVKRRVQHYGYVFDYETANVLRDRNAAGAGCPPLPAIPADDGPHGVKCIKSDDEVEAFVSRSVEEGRGWETLAGIIERTRRVDFAPHLSTSEARIESREDGLTSDVCDNHIETSAQICLSQAQTHHGLESSLKPTVDEINASDHGPISFPHLNQLTVNEYAPGQGIGSHIDTPSAFGDGLISIALNGGIVMEFRYNPPNADSDKEGPHRVARDGNSKHEPNEAVVGVGMSPEPDDEEIALGERSKVSCGGKKLGKLAYLPPRSLLLMSGPARYEWEHMIVSRRTDTVDGQVKERKLRVSLTLRTALCAPPLGHLPLERAESSEFPPRWTEFGSAKRGGHESGSGENYVSSGKFTGEGSRARMSSMREQTDIATPFTERNHVHAVYDAIATQWHHTRGKRGVLWPGATQFLKSIPPGSVVADVGCGDGKYFPTVIEAGSYVIGTDISLPLLRTSVGSGLDGPAAAVPKNRQVGEDKTSLMARPAVVAADCMHIPFRTGSCDAAICIAVMHHLSTEARRVRCLSELARVVKAGGMINIQAWAMEQEEGSRRRFAGTDIFVPFNAQPRYLDKVQTNGEAQQRASTKPPVSNKNQTPLTVQDMSGTESSSKSGSKGVAQMYSEAYEGAEFDEVKGLVVFKRYCHLYRKGELEDLTARVKNLELVESGFESGNHFIVVKVIRHEDTE